MPAPLPSAPLGLAPSLRQSTDVEFRYAGGLYARARKLGLACSAAAVVGLAPFAVDLWREEPVAGAFVALLVAGAAYAIWWYADRFFSGQPTRRVVRLSGPLVAAELDPNDPWGGCYVGGSRAVVPGPWRDHIGEGDKVRCQAVVVESPHRADVSVVVRLAPEGGPELSVEAEAGTGTPLDDSKPAALLFAGWLVWMVAAGLAVVAAAGGQHGRGTAIVAGGVALVGGASFALGAILYERSRRRFFDLYRVGTAAVTGFQRARWRRLVTAGAAGAALFAAAGMWFVPWWSAALYGAIGFLMIGAYLPVRYPTLRVSARESWL